MNVNSAAIIPQPNWYVSGATAGEHCERLLASSAWQQISTNTYEGLLERLKLMSKAGLPKMRVISARTLMRLERIPRSNENFAEDAYEAIKQCGKDPNNYPKAVLVFFSHRWLRPNWCEMLGNDVAWGSPERIFAENAGCAVGDVDDAQHSKATALISWIRWVTAFMRVGRSTGLFTHLTRNYHDDMQLFFWIDWPCVDQTNPGPDMAALPAYVAISHMIASYWTPDYEGRAWCQVELMMAYAFNTLGDRIFVIPQNFEYNCDSDTTTSTSHGTVTLGLKGEKCVVPDPLSGNLTNPNDRDVIKGLRTTAMSSKAFTCFQVAYKETTRGCWWGICMNVCLCCQCCCLIPYNQARSLEPGKSTVTKWIPA